MMLPTLIQTYKVKLLEVQFKKADSIIQQALTKSVQEFGYDSITDFNFCVRLPEAEKAEKLAETQALMSEFNKIWLNQFKDPRPLDKMALSVHLMTGEKSNNIYYVIGRTPYITADGMLITEVDAFEGGINHPIMLRFVFDTNGPYKGPNRLGHDIFIYDSHPFGGQYYDMCDTIKALTYAQWGCYSYARKNISPIDNKKTYWDILYKPRSYWGQ